MAKRKAAVNDIIYELDSEDIEISDDEVTQPKSIKLDETNSPVTTQSDSNTQSSLEVIDIDSSTDKIAEVMSPRSMSNGGKLLDEFIIIDEASDTPTTSPMPPGADADRRRILNPDTIFNENIMIDSPASNSDPGVVGCENRTPLVTVRFRDSKLAMNYKKKIKAFILSLIKLHDDTDDDGDDDTDLELDIWPEDINNVEDDCTEKPEDNLFFIDTDPSIDVPHEIPRYSQNLTMISNTSEEEPTPPRIFRKGPICFNCEGSHSLRDCKLPRNNHLIAERRKAIQKLGRYHVEDDQKYGHLVAGRISGALRHALGLKRHELPLHIYRMRHLGYPPGWLEEARISHSGITLFDSSGQATLDPLEEEGELCEPGSKDKFDIKKILDFPGFNVPASSRYKEEGQKLGFPPMSTQDSKMVMLQVLAPNAMKAYKRKKLTFFPSAPENAPVAGPAEMDIDSGDEIADFPSQPPLPDDAPPSPPPPPESPPPPPESPPPADLPPPPSDSTTSLPTETPQETSPSQEKLDITPANNTLQEEKPNSTADSPVTKKADAQDVKGDKTETNDDDIEVVEVIQVDQIPVPITDLITVDVDGETSNPASGPTSPSLEYLERQKKLLLDALETDVTSDAAENDDIPETDETNHIEKEIDNDESVTESNTTSEVVEVSSVEQESSSNKVTTNDNEMNEIQNSDTEDKTSTKTGEVRATHYGTPILNIASPYDKLPSDDKFAKDICDVIHFENLPNSTGKYKQISTLLKKVKSEVDRIQES